MYTKAYMQSYAFLQNVAADCTVETGQYVDSLFAETIETAVLSLRSIRPVSFYEPSEDVPVELRGCRDAVDCFPEFVIWCVGVKKKNAFTCVAVELYQ